MKPHKPDSTTWTAREDLVVKIAAPEVAAEKLGRSFAAVMMRRHELGLGKYDPTRAKRPRDRQ